MISLFNLSRQFKDIGIYDSSGRNRFSKREIIDNSSALSVSDCSISDDSVNIYKHKFKSLWRRAVLLGG